jgi:hypothetical protein
VRDGDDLNVMQAFAKDNGEWKPIKKCAAGTVQIKRASERTLRK